MENIFVLIFSLFREYVCLLIAEHEGRKTELANAFFSFTKLIFFFFSVSF